MKSKYLKYLFLIIYGVVISSGPVCMAYMTAPREIGYSIILLMIPNALMLYAGLYLCTRVFYSRFLKKGRYVSFAICAWLVAYLTDLSVFYVEYFFRDIKGLPQVIQHPGSPWIFIYAISSSMLFLLTFCGFLLWHFYENNRKQNAYERAYKKEIEEKAKLFRNRIKMPEIKRRLNEVINTINDDPEKANRQIRRLSDFLRHNLYDVPQPKASHQSPLPDKKQLVSDSPWSADFITRKRYRIKRHLLLLLAVVTICFGLTYDFPDQPIFDSYHIGYALTFVVIISSLIYANLYLIFPLFLKKERQRLYAFLLAGILFGVFILLNILTFTHGDLVNPYGLEIPWFIVPLAIAGNLLTFLLLLAGTSSAVLLKRNILGKWRLGRLEAERVELEFENLQQQINPHTLFNLLNNVGILSYEDPAEAVVTLKSLEGFLDYILADSARGSTTIRKEIAFIDNYLTMEKSSGKLLAVDMSCPASVLSLHMPPLLLIPFVENAVKHSGSVVENRFIEIKFGKEGDDLTFLCRNPYLPANKTSPLGNLKSSGLGITNTRRRLELLYGDNFKLTATASGHIFTITLKIPLSK
ncbi:MAG: histidine kinase [Muribaculaceae bacterium]|nr:histidine kinase [Muribaculaceae bacterium]